MRQFVKIDGKIQTDVIYLDGFIDIIGINKTKENFHMIYDTKGHFAVH